MGLLSKQWWEPEEKVAHGFWSEAREYIACNNLLHPRQFLHQISQFQRMT